jgi:hypothetical protein
VRTYDQLDGGFNAEGSTVDVLGCYPFLSRATSADSVSSISWGCDENMTTYIDSSGPSCQTQLAVSWSATPSPPAVPSASPAACRFFRPQGAPPPPVIAYTAPFDGADCVKQQDSDLSSNKYTVSECPWSPPPSTALSPGAIAAISFAVIGSVAIAGFAAICVLQAQRTLNLRKQRAKARGSATMMSPVRVAST